MLVVDRRSRTSEIVDFVHLDVERECHVVAQKLKTGMGMKMLNVPLRAREKVVQAQYLVPVLYQAINQVGSQEARASGYENTFAAIVDARHLFISYWKD